MDFQFLQNPISKKWVVLAPRRAKRPDVAKGTEPVCPFCPGREGEEKELYRVPATSWLVRVIPNKFPFAPIHEIVINSPDHHKNFGEFSMSQVELILKTYQQRFLEHQNKGQVIIFHNRGEKAGESLPHSHTQIAVVPNEIKIEMPRLIQNSTPIESEYFYISCPPTSQWPDEVWVSPKNTGRNFGEITDFEISDFAFTINRLVEIFNSRHGFDFPFNFYLYPGGNWYFRLIPRLKVIGGFELSTGIFVNTQDPAETLAFIKEHFETPDHERIKAKHQAKYHLRP